MTLDFSTKDRTCRELTGTAVMWILNTRVYWGERILDLGWWSLCMILAQVARCVMPGESIVKDKPAEHTSAYKGLHSSVSNAVP